MVKYLVNSCGYIHILVQFRLSHSCSKGPCACHTKHAPVAFLWVRHSRWLTHDPLCDSLPKAVCMCVMPVIKRVKPMGPSILSLYICLYEALQSVCMPGAVVADSLCQTLQPDWSQACSVTPCEDRDVLAVPKGNIVPSASGRPHPVLSGWCTWTKHYACLLHNYLWDAITCFGAMHKQPVHGRHVMLHSSPCQRTICLVSSLLSCGIHRPVMSRFTQRPPIPAKATKPLVQKQAIIHRHSRVVTAF